VRANAAGLHAPAARRGQARRGWGGGLLSGIVTSALLGETPARCSLWPKTLRRLAPQV
jgi:hypothetical protein